MRILFLSDTHIRASAPEGRTDDFLRTQTGKWEFIFDTAEEENVDLILQAGDLFDSYKPPYSLPTELVRMLRESNASFFCISGQHDLMCRSKNIDKTALGVMKATGLINVLSCEGFYFKPNRGKGINLYGMNFGDDYDDLDRSLKLQCDHEAIKILVVHDMIGDVELFPGQELTDAGKFLATWKEFAIIICGDYHYDYFIENDGRVILNTGCLLRLQRVERDMKRHPHFYIYDTETKQFDKHYIPISPWKKVFRIEEKPQVETMELIEFIEKLKQSEKVGISFLENLDIYFEENNVKPEVRALIEGSLENG